MRRPTPGTDVILSVSRDDAVLRALQAGEADLAAIGRPLTEEELAQNLTEVPISREKIAIIVGRDNPFQGDLTFEDFARILWGDITNWSQLGGARSTPAVYRPPRRERYPHRPCRL